MGSIFVASLVECLNFGKLAKSQLFTPVRQVIWGVSA